MAMTRLPNKLKVVLKPEKKVSRFVMGQEQTTLVRPAFIAPADSPEMLETAVAWARGYSKQGYVTAKERGYRLHGKEPEILDLDNSIFTELKVWKIEHRGEGGIAYKVITTEGWYVDLREAEFMDALCLHGVKKDGALKGVFQWVRSGSSQMRIAYVDSKLHRECVEDDKRTAHKPIPLGKLVVGGVYQGSHPHEQVYLGKVKLKGVTHHAWHALNSYGQRHGLPATDYQGRFDYEQRCSPHIQIVKSKRVLVKVGQLTVSEVRVSYFEGWSHGRIDGDALEWCDLPRHQE